LPLLEARGAKAAALFETSLCWSNASRSKSATSRRSEARVVVLRGLTGIGKDDAGGSIGFS